MWTRLMGLINRKPQGPNGHPIFHLDAIDHLDRSIADGDAPAHRVPPSMVFVGHPVIGIYFGTVESLANMVGWHPDEDRMNALIGILEAWEWPGDDAPIEKQMAAQLATLNVADREVAEAWLIRLLLDRAQRMGKLAKAS